MNYIIISAKTVEEAVTKGLEELNIPKDKAEIEILEEPSKGFLGLIGSKEATVKVSEIQDTKDILKEIFSNDSFSNEEKKENKTEKKATKEKTIIKPKTVEKVEEVIVEKEVKKEVEKEELSKAVENYVELEKEKSETVDLEEIKKTTTEFISKIIEPLGLDFKLEINFDENILNVNILGEEEQLGIVIGKRGATLDAIQYILSLMINKDHNKYIRVNLDSSGYRLKREQTLTSLAGKMANKVMKTGRPVKLEPMSSAERRIIHSSVQGFKDITTHSEGKDPYRRVVIQKERK